MYLPDILRQRLEQIVRCLESAFLKGQANCNYLSKLRIRIGNAKQTLVHQTNKDHQIPKACCMLLRVSSMINTIMEISDHQKPGVSTFPRMQLSKHTREGVSHHGQWDKPSGHPVQRAAP